MGVHISFNSIAWLIQTNADKRQVTNEQLSILLHLDRLENKC